MTTRPATRDVIVAYIRADSEPRHVLAILDYMTTMHMMERNAVRQQLYRLRKKGIIVWTPPHWYSLAGA